MKTYNVKRYILLTDADEMITSTQHPTTKNIKNKHSTQRRRRSNEFEMLEEHLEIFDFPEHREDNDFEKYRCSPDLFENTEVIDQMDINIPCKQTIKGI